MKGGELEIEEVGRLNSKEKISPQQPLRLGLV